MKAPLPFPFLIGQAFSEEIARQLGTPPLPPFDAHELLRRAVGDEPSWEVLVRMHKPRRREVAQALNELLGTQRLDDEHIKAAMWEAGQRWFAQKAELNDPRPASVKAHLENGTLVRVIRGEDCVYRTPPGAPGEALPTDHGELLERAIYPACELIGSAAVVQKLEQALREACVDALGAFCAVQCVWMQHNRQTGDSETPFQLPVGRLLPFLASRCLALRRSFQRVDPQVDRDGWGTVQVRFDLILTNLQLRATPRLSDFEIRKRVHALCIQGDEALTTQDLAGAARAYREALALLPTGRDACRESVWVHAALGDLHMHAADFVEASKAFDRAIHCTSHALETPYLQWRLGQSLYERGDYDQAANSLRAACRNGGRNLFAQEDPKYQAFLQSHRPTPTPLSRAKPTDMLDEQIGSCVKQVAGLLSEAAGGTKVWGSHFGPTSLDPNHLLVYFVFPGRADVSAAQESHAWADAKRHLRDMLKAAGVSAERLQSYRVELYSEEQCKEEANGNWYHFFK